MRSCLLPVAIWLSATGGVLAACEAAPCDFGLPGDLDHDGDVDPSDFVLFRQCETGSVSGPPIDCSPADLNRDGSVDAADFALWQTFYTGSCDCGAMLKEPRTASLSPAIRGDWRKTAASESAGADVIGRDLPAPLWLKAPPSPAGDMAAGARESLPLDFEAVRPPDERAPGPGGPEIPDPNPMFRVHGHSGEFHMEVTDLRIRGRGLDLVWTRTYRSRTGPDTVAGNGWDFSFNIAIEPAGAHMRLRDGRGRSDVLLRQRDGAWSRRELFAVLEKSGSTHTLSRADGQRWQFRALDGSPAAGRIHRIVDRNGNSLTFSYDFRGRLTTVHDALDTAAHTRDLRIAYNSDGYIESITDFAGRRVTYEYYAADSTDGSRGDLRSVTTPAVTGTPTGNDFPRGKTTTYTYSRGESDERLNHNLLTITDGAGRTWLANTYSRRPDGPAGLTFDRVVRQVYGSAGDHIDTVYQAIAPSAQNNGAAVKATVNDRVGNVRVYYYDSRHRLVLQRDYTGRADADQPTVLDRQVNPPTRPLRPSDPAYFETRREYNEDSLLTRIVRPERDEELFTYDTSHADARARANLLEHVLLPGPAGGDQAQRMERFEYDPVVHRVTRHVDFRGNETVYGYDESGNCIRIRPPRGTAAEYFEYNAFGQLTARVRPGAGEGVRRRDEFVYHASGPQQGFLRSCVLDVNGLGLTFHYQYDLLGRLIVRRDPRGLESLYDWNALDQLVRRASPEVSPGTGARSYCDYVYDAGDDLVQVDQGGWGEAASESVSAQISTVFEYDPLGYPLRRTDRGTGVAVTTAYGYDENRNHTLTRYGEATAGRQPTNTLTTLYDERDLPLRVIRAAGDPVQSSIQYDYDGNGRVRRIAEGLESLSPRVTSLVYDGYGQRVLRRDAMGNEETLRYDPAGNVVGRRFEGELNDAADGEKNVRLSESTRDYDEFNRLVRRVEKFFDPQTQAAIDDGEAVTRFEYTDSGLLRRRIDDLGHATVCEYDSLGRCRSIRDARGNSTTFSYDASSNLVGAAETLKSDLGRPDSTFTRTFEYDGLNRLIRRCDSGDHVTRYVWDALGRCALVVNPRGHQTRHVHDALGRLLAVIIDMDGGGPDASDPGDIALSQRWDDSSRLVAQTDASLNTTVYTYDPLNRLIATRCADGTSRTVVYDVFDRPVVTGDPTGTTIRSAYDALDRLTSRTIIRGAGVSGVATESYAYDGLSRLVAGSDDDSAITRRHNSLGHVVRETQSAVPGGAVRTVAAVFDSLGRRTSLSYPGGRVVTTEYDEAGRPAFLRDETAGRSLLLAAYSFLGPELIERRDLGNGVRLEVGYDDHRRAATVRYSLTGTGALLFDRAYAWDPCGNRVGVERPSAVDGAGGGYAYDAANRLVESQRAPGPLTIAYGLDGAGNRTSVSGGSEAGAYLLDPAVPEPADLQMNQYTAIPGQTRTYDRTGNLITAGSACRYSYDYRGQLTELTDLAAGLTVLYKYDVLGRRIEKNAAGLITRYYHWGDQEIEEQNAANITLVTYVHPPVRRGERGFREAGPITLTRGAQRSFRLVDDLGSALALTGNGGVVLEQYDYGNFGQPAFMDPGGAPLNSSVAGNPFLFRGNRYEMESGFYVVPPVISASGLATASGGGMPDDFVIPNPDPVWSMPLAVTCEDRRRTAPARLGDSACGHYDPIAGRFITRTAAPPWAPGTLGNFYTAWANNPLSP